MAAPHAPRRHHRPGLRHRDGEPQLDQPASQTSPQQIFNNPAAPYINSLVTPGNANAQYVSYASNYQNAGVGIHPSEPNYIWAEAGSNLGVLNDNLPYGAGGTNQNTSQHLTPSRTPRASPEVLPGGHRHRRRGQRRPNNSGLPPSQPQRNVHHRRQPLQRQRQYNYAPKHKTADLLLRHQTAATTPRHQTPPPTFYAPLQQFQTDLMGAYSQYNFITPNQFNDQHTALTGRLQLPRHAAHRRRRSHRPGRHFLSLSSPRSSPRRVPESERHQHHLE